MNGNSRCTKVSPTSYLRLLYQSKTNYSHMQCKMFNVRWSSKGENALRTTFCVSYHLFLSPCRYRYFIKIFLLWPQVHCGHQPCLLQSDSGEPQRPLCPLGQECVEHHFLSCLRPPCNHLGICSTREHPQPIGTRCLPNNGYLDDNCARVTLVFDSDSIPQVRVFHLVNAKSTESQID